MSFWARKITKIWLVAIIVIICIIIIIIIIPIVISFKLIKKGFFLVRSVFNFILVWRCLDWSLNQLQPLLSKLLFLFTLPDLNSELFFLDLNHLMYFICFIVFFHAIHPTIPCYFLTYLSLSLSQSWLVSK